MGFFDKLKEKMDDLLDDKDKDKDKNKQDQQNQQHGPGGGDRGASDSYYQSGPPQDHGNQYGSQPQGYGGPPPPQNYGGPPGEPPLPPGWVKQWDQNSNRWYFIEQATGRSQWDPPAPPQGSHGQYGAPPPGGGQGYDQSRGAPAGYPNYQGQTYPPAPGQHGYPYGQYPEEERKKGMNPMVAGVAGAAVGAAGGAWIAHELTEDNNQTAATSGGGAYGAPPTGYGGDPNAYSNAPGGVPPPPPEADPNLSSSDRESVGEAADDVRDAQKEYDEALASGSSSDIEEAREDLADAHEEYQEEVEEAYDD